MSYVERYYLCQVPGCSAKIKRPWNHISQGRLHGDLAPDQKKIYIELTKTAGLVQEQKPAAQLDDNPKDIQPIEVVSSGRQRFGSTKSMKSHPVDTPILVEFKK